MQRCHKRHRRSGSVASRDRNPRSAPVGRAAPRQYAHNDGLAGVLLVFAGLLVVEVDSGLWELDLPVRLPFESDAFHAITDIYKISKAQRKRSKTRRGSGSWY